MNLTNAKSRGPHPLPLFLALASRIAGDDLDRLSQILAGLRRYQQAAIPPPLPPFAEVSGRGGVRLLRVSHGSSPADPPLVVIPSLINSPSVLDLAPERSFVRFMADEGHDTHLLDWGAIGKSERRLGLTGLVSQRLMPLLLQFDRPVRLVGYCLGGTLAIAAAQLLGNRAERLGLIATPWNYAGFSESARKQARIVLQAVELLGRHLGAVPVSTLNPLFWSLDEESVIRKFETLAQRPEQDPHIGWFARVEDWTNSGAPLSLAAARDIFQRGFLENHFGTGRWRVAGTVIDPANIQAPIFDLGGSQDRIVPPAARLQLSHIIRSNVQAGHVGMVVGSSARETLWQPLSNWLRGA